MIQISNPVGSGCVQSQVFLFDPCFSFSSILGSVQVKFGPGLDPLVALWSDSCSGRGPYSGTGLSPSLGLGPSWSCFSRRKCCLDQVTTILFFFNLNGVRLFKK